MNGFTYDIPTVVHFGSLNDDKISYEIGKYGKNVLFVYGGGSIKKNGLYERIYSICKSHNYKICELSGISPNPDIKYVREGIDICKKNDIDIVLAVGGGSVIDTAKWIAAGANAEFDAWDFFGKWAPVDEALPVISIVTISGTGSEMDSSGVISNNLTHDKIGRSDYKLFPKAAFLDPALTYSVGKYQTACGAIDIFSHVAEVYFNPNKDLDIFDDVMESIMRSVLKYAPIALREPDNYEARANLMWAAPWAINGFAVGTKKQSWSSHKIEHQLSAYYPITHGEGIAIILVNWLKYCLNPTTLPKYVQFGKRVFSINPDLDEMDIALESINRLNDFCFKTLGLNSNLKSLGVTDEHFKEMALKACFGTEIKGFVTLSPDDVVAIFKMSM